jgi:Kef-type K+ transport system membrane component KefB
MENLWQAAAIWMGVAFAASLISIRTGISVALIEIVVGVVAGNSSWGGQRHILKTTRAWRATGWMNG